MSESKRDEKWPLTAEKLSSFANGVRPRQLLNAQPGRIHRTARSAGNFRLLRWGAGREHTQARCATLDVQDAAFPQSIRGCRVCLVVAASASCATGGALQSNGEIPKSLFASRLSRSKARGRVGRNNEGDRAAHEERAAIALRTPGFESDDVPNLSAGLPTLSSKNGFFRRFLRFGPTRY